MFSSRNKKKYRYFLVEKSALSRALIIFGIGRPVKDEFSMCIGGSDQSSWGLLLNCQGFKTSEEENEISDQAS